MQSRFLLILSVLITAGKVLTTSGQDIESKLDSLTDKVDTLVDEVEDAGEQMEEIGTELDDFGDEIDDLEDEFDDVGDTLGDLEREIITQRNEFETKLDALGQQLSDKIETIGNGIDTLETDMKKALDTLKQLQEQLHVVPASSEVTPDDTLCKQAEEYGSLAQPQYLPRSCRDIIQANASAQSGYYWVRSTDNYTAVYAYLDMNRQCCGKTGCWIRAAYVNMSDPHQQCPGGFSVRTNPKRVCGRTTISAGCTSIFFHVHKLHYSRVCGRVKAYQYGATNAFYPGRYGANIDSTYVVGVSLTHGENPRRHIWTFAAAQDEKRSDRNSCPCTKTDTTYTGSVPSFVGTNYFCDTGSHEYAQAGTCYHDDPLWDGEGCGPTSLCCQFNSPPWFCEQFPLPIQDDLELRVCSDDSSNSEEILLELIELYVQ